MAELLRRGSVTRCDLIRLREMVPPAPFSGDVSVQVNPRSPDWAALRCAQCAGCCKYSFSECPDDAKEQLDYGIQMFEESGEPWAAIRLVDSFLQKDWPSSMVNSAAETHSLLVDLIDNEYQCGGHRDTATAPTRRAEHH